MRSFEQKLTASVLAAACLMGVQARADEADDNASADQSQGDAHAIEFVIDDGRVVPSEDFAVKVSVIGAAITYGANGPDVPVTVGIHVGENYFEPFGSATNPHNGDVNDHGLARHLVLDHTFDTDSQIIVTGRAWKPYEYGGGLLSTRNSNEQSALVKVLRDGDAVPDIRAFGNQANVVMFLQQYIDPTNDVMLLHENQAIYLFELGTSNPNSSSADFQDLVVLVTLGESPEALREDPADPLGTVEPLYD